MTSRYGTHCSAIPDALTLFELGGRISALGHELGCQVFSQFPPTFRPGRKGETIDYVWAFRSGDRSEQRRWHVLAAFECEGVDVPDASLTADVSKLADVAADESTPTAVVLYRTCEDGSLFWGPGADWQQRQCQLLESANRRLRTLCTARGVTAIPAIIDHEFVAPYSGAVQQMIGRVQARLATLTRIV